MELAQGAQLAYFDIHGGYYEDPVIMAGVAQVNRLREDALQWPDRGSNAQILLLMDEASEHVLTFRNPILTYLLSAQVAVMPFVAPYDVALLSDLPALDVGRYRLVLVLNAAEVSSRLRGAMQRKLLGAGRTVVWLHAPGLFCDGQRSDRFMQDLTGLRIRRTGAERQGGVPAQPVAAPAQGCQFPLLRGEALRVDDPAATPLAVTGGDAPETVVAQRDFGSWRSVYSDCAPLDARFLRLLARQAGVHLYTDDPRWLLFAGPHCLTIGADKEGGEVTIRLPRKRQLSDATTGAALGATRQFTVQLRPREVRLYVLR